MDDGYGDGDETIAMRKRKKRWGVMMAKTQGRGGQGFGQYELASAALSGRDSHLQ